jgi:NAD(P)-dependent dehydrogenase (short-subunit alcohol dehydrogenase family)
MTTSQRLTGRIALVTGASRGIGRAVSLALAREGAHLVLCARTQGALEELDDEIQALGGTATILKLDLRDGDRIDQLGPSLYQRWGRLDLLVASAGILGPLSPLPHVTADAWSAVMDTNLNANWRLIRTLDPLFRASDGARVLLVTSEVATGEHAYWGPYAVANAGLEALARTYGAEMAATKVRVSIVDPGPVRTVMRSKAFPGEDATTLPSPEDVAPFFLDLAIEPAPPVSTVLQFADWHEANTASGDRDDAS